MGTGYPDLPYPGVPAGNNHEERISELERSQAVTEFQIKTLVETDNRLGILLERLAIKVDRLTWALTLAALSLAGTAIVMIVEFGRGS